MLTAAIMAAPMLIFSSSQPMMPVTTKMGRMLGIRATAASSGLRKAASIISPIAVVATPKVTHWSRNMLSMRLVSRTKNPVTSAAASFSVPGKTSRLIWVTWSISRCFCWEDWRSRARNMIRAKYLPGCWGSSAYRLAATSGISSTSRRYLTRTSTLRAT